MNSQISLHHLTLCGFFSSLLRSRLLHLHPCQLLLLEPGGLRRGRTGQGFPQGRGGAGHNVGHRRLRLQRLRLPHGQSVSAPSPLLWASPLPSFFGIWQLLSSPRAARHESCCCYATVGECAFQRQCCKNLNIFNFNACSTERRSNTWLSVLSGKKPRNFLPLRRLKDVIKTMKLQDRPTLLALNSTQEGHIYSLGSYFGFTAFSRHFFLSAQGIIRDYKGAFCQLYTLYCVCHLGIDLTAA